MSGAGAMSPLPQLCRLAYAARPVSTVLEQQPEIAKPGWKKPGLPYSVIKGQSPQSQPVAALRFPYIVGFCKPLLGRTGFVRPNAASSRVAPATRGA